MARPIWPASFATCGGRMVSRLPERARRGGCHGGAAFATLLLHRTASAAFTRRRSTSPARSHHLCPRECAARTQSSERWRCGARSPSTPKAGERRPPTHWCCTSSRPGARVRSGQTHARILAIDVADAVTMPGVHAVLTHADVPGEKTYGLEFRDQPVLAIDRVRYFGEPVVLVAAEHPEQARRAAERVQVEYEPLEPVTDMERATSGPELHPDSDTRHH